MEHLMSSPRINITVPEKLAEFVNRRAELGGFTSPGEFVRHLIREEQNRELAQLNAMIQEGIDSGPSERTPKQIFAAIDKELDDIQKKAKRKRKKS